MEVRRIGTHQRSFGRYYSQSICPDLPLDWRFATPTQSSNRKLLRETSALCTYNNSLYGRPVGFWEQRVRAQSGTARFFCWAIISGTGKATDFKFCMHIHMVDRNKIPWKNFRKSSLGPENFQGTQAYIQGASRGHLCDSTAFLFNFQFCFLLNVCFKHLRNFTVGYHNGPEWGMTKYESGTLKSHCQPQSIHLSIVYV